MPAITWHDGAVYIAMNNRDQLDIMWPGKFTAKENAERPAEPLYRAVAGIELRLALLLLRLRPEEIPPNPEYGGDGKTVGRCTRIHSAGGRFSRALGAGRHRVLFRQAVSG